MEELIDILYENGDKTGKIVTRKQVHEQGLWHGAIVVAIINDNNEILLQQRSLKKEKNAGIWDISVAGHISSNQTALETAIRETSEEIGQNIKEDKFEYINTYKTSIMYKEDFIENQFYSFYIVKENINVKNIKMQEDEVQDIKYVSLNELEEMIKNKTIVDRKEVYNELIKYMKEASLS